MSLKITLYNVEYEAFPNGGSTKRAKLWLFRGTVYGNTAKFRFNTTEDFKRELLTLIPQSVKDDHKMESRVIFLEDVVSTNVSDILKLQSENVVRDSRIKELESENISIQSVLNDNEKERLVLKSELEYLKVQLSEITITMNKMQDETLFLKEQIAALESYVVYLKSGRCKVDESYTDENGKYHIGSIAYKELQLDAMKQELYNSVSNDEPDFVSTADETFPGYEHNEVDHWDF
eukprot:TRINITY_DN2799_c0_g1_i2.p2 TRINITY_DN2799_c0_g1~~TRINITY_DN2799_c0_g1_i2.p2  ORF type:complete len:234 (-),score=53.13 TRINITY_DN2799_c0_g1_i2:1303-2004(-)